MIRRTTRPAAARGACALGGADCCARGGADCCTRTDHRALRADEHWRAARAREAVRRTCGRPLEAWRLKPYSYCVLSTLVYAGTGTKNLIADLRGDSITNDSHRHAR